MKPLSKYSIRRTILRFLHEKVFRYDAGHERNKFTNFVAAILMPIWYIVEHNTSLRYDWNRDTYTINKMEFTGEFLRAIHAGKFPKVYDSKENLIANDIDIDGYPPLPVLLAHYAAISTLIEEVNKGTGNFTMWDKKRVKSSDFRDIPIRFARRISYDESIRCLMYNPKPLKEIITTYGIENYLGILNPEGTKFELNNGKLKLATTQREETMKVNLEIAKLCHEANRQYCIDNQLKAGAVWDETPLHIQESIVAGVAEVIADPKVTPAESHQKWVDYKTKQGWKFDKVLNVGKKLHPNLVPFKKLSKDEQIKDKIFIGTVLKEIKK